MLQIVVLGAGCAETLLEDLEFFELVVEFVVCFLGDLVLVVQQLLGILLEIVEACGCEAREDVVRIGDHELVELVLLVNFVEVLVRNALDSPEI